MLCDALIGQSYVCMMPSDVMWVGGCGGTCAQQLQVHCKLEIVALRLPLLMISKRVIVSASLFIGLGLGAGGSDADAWSWSITEQFENYQELISNECIEFWEMHRHTVTVPVICARVLLILTLSTVAVVGTGQCSVSSIPGMGRTKRAAVVRSSARI